MLTTTLERDAVTMPDRSTEFDHHMMAVALNVAKRGLGQTAPNPSVGAVIADPHSGVVFARATTARGGRPHAETQAITQAGDKARGATMYVTLEPCAHHGQTGPCADAIIAAGVSRVVVAIEDPDPRMAGRGLERLRNAGIDVIRGVGADDARAITRGHIVRVTERRPCVTLKMAVDGDGNIARGTGAQPVWVTGPEARAYSHLLRARTDAILVGAGTVRDDDPELTCRLPGLENRSPIRIVLSRQLKVSANSNLVRTIAQAPVIVVASAEADAAHRTVLEAAGVTVISAPIVAGHLWLPAVMEALVARGVTRLLVEGGPGMWRAFANASLVDDVVVTMAGHDGGARVNTLNATAEDHVRSVVARYLGYVPRDCVERRHLVSDTMWRFSRVQSKKGS